MCGYKEEKILILQSIPKEFLVYVGILPEPEPCVNREKVITFFKCDSAKEMYSKLKPAMELLDKYNRAYDVVYTNFVGTIVYEDEWQIAVKVKDGEMIY